MFPQHEKFYDRFSEYLAEIPGAINSLSRFRNMMYYPMSMRVDGGRNYGPHNYDRDLPTPEYGFLTPENGDQRIVESNNLWFVFREIFTDKMDEYFDSGAYFDTKESQDHIIYELAKHDLIDASDVHTGELGEIVDKDYLQIVRSPQLLMLAVRTDEDIERIFNHADEYDEEDLINLADVMPIIKGKYVQYFRNIPTFYSLGMLSLFDLSDPEFYNSDFISDYITRFDLDTEVIRDATTDPYILSLCYPETLSEIYKLKPYIDLEKISKIVPDYKFPEYICASLVIKYFENGVFPAVYTYNTLMTMFKMLSDERKIEKMPKSNMKYDILKIGYLIDQYDPSGEYYQKALKQLESSSNDDYHNIDTVSPQQTYIEENFHELREISVYGPDRVLYSKIFVKPTPPGYTYTRSGNTEFYSLLLNQTYHFRRPSYSDTKIIDKSNKSKLLKLIKDPNVTSYDWDLVKDLIPQISK